MTIQIKTIQIKRVVCAFILCTPLFLLTTPLQAEESPPVLVVDMNRVFRDSIAGKAAIANYEEERKKRGQVLMKIEADLKKLDEAISKQGAILSATAIAEKREQFEKKRLEGARAAQDAQRELAKYQQGEFGKVLKQVDDIVEQLAEKKKGRFVLDYDKRVVLFAHERLDLTNDLLEALDERALKS